MQSCFSIYRGSVCPRCKYHIRIIAKRWECRSNRPKGVLQMVLDCLQIGSAQTLSMRRGAGNKTILDAWSLRNTCGATTSQFPVPHGNPSVSGKRHSAPCSGLCARWTCQTEMMQTLHHYTISLSGSFWLTLRDCTRLNLESHAYHENTQECNNSPNACQGWRQKKWIWHNVVVKPPGRKKTTVNMKPVGKVKQKVVCWTLSGAVQTPPKSCCNATPMEISYGPHCFWSILFPYVPHYLGQLGCV